MKKLFFTLFVTLLVFMCFVPFSTAQETKPESFSPNQSDVNSKHAEMQAKMRTMIMMRLVEYLDLNEDQSAKLFPVMKESNEIRNKLTKERGELIHEIRKNIDDESVSTKDLRKLVKELEKIDDEMLNEHKEFLKKSEKILEERQYIKLILFEDRLKEDLFQRFRSREPREKNDNK